ncbi:ABC transporter permease [Devosia pacifica]|uniref:ABC transporter permease n=1 Tax=Devosia pacifica TaxID=1335967 RepID=A0A918VL03_9HYPH|nr:ABC transporter permease [Devosia pacifica]GHA10086.1 ABC transporter permease [Devosia pacifica]
MARKSTFLLLTPGLFVTGAVFLSPFAFLALTSFWTQRPNSLLVDPAFTLVNYVRIATDMFFLRVLFHTIYLGVITVLVCLVLGLPIARWIARRAVVSRGILVVLIVTPMVSGAVVQTLGLVNLLSLLGVINGLLKQLGLIDRSIRFLGDELGVLIGLVQAFLPLMVLPLLNTMSKLPEDLESAARSLGAPAWRLWMLVILPLSMPGIIAGSVLVFFASVTSFVTPQILGQGRIQTFGTVMYQQSALVNDWPFASALAVTMMVLLGGLVLALRAIRQRLARRSNVAGAV